MVSADEQSWCLYPLAHGVFWEGWPLKASSLAPEGCPRQLLVGRRQARNTASSLSHTPYRPRIKEEAQGWSPGSAS